MLPKLLLPIESPLGRPAAFPFLSFPFLSFPFLSFPSLRFASLCFAFLPLNLLHRVQSLVQHFTSAFEETKRELEGISSDTDASFL